MLGRRRLRRLRADPRTTGFDDGAAARWPARRASAAGSHDGHIVRARRPDGGRRASRRGGRVLARRRPLLLRAVRRRRTARSPCWRSADATRRAAEQRGHRRCSPRWPARSPPRSRTPGSTAQLHLKAAELDRLRAFNENILESLDDGLLVVGGDDAVVRWNHALERIYGLRRGEAVGRALDALFDAAGRRGAAAARAATRPTAAPIYRVPLAAARPRAASALLVNVTTVPLLPMPAAATGRHDRHVRGRHRARRSSKSSCGSPRRWRRSACWPPAWRTRSTRR